MQEGITNVKFMKCLTQMNEDIEAVMSQLVPSSGAGWGANIEFRIGMSNGLYLPATSYGKNAYGVTHNTTCKGSSEA